MTEDAYETLNKTLILLGLAAVACTVLFGGCHPQRSNDPEIEHRILEQRRMELKVEYDRGWLDGFRAFKAAAHSTNMSR
jgi:hypothetical protein